MLTYLGSPQVLRDVAYGIVRNNVTGMMIERNPEFAKTDLGRFVNMFLTVFIACLMSAPGNEYRGTMFSIWRAWHLEVTAGKAVV